LSSATKNKPASAAKNMALIMRPRGHGQWKKHARKERNSMTPEFPSFFEAPDPASLSLSVLPQSSAEQECCMVRMGMQCNNATREALLYPTSSASYRSLPVCEVCLGDL